MSAKGLRIVIPLIAVILPVGLLCDAKAMIIFALVVVLLCIYCFAAVFWAGRTMNIQVDKSSSTVQRGDNVDVEVMFSHSCPLFGLIMHHEYAEGNEAAEDEHFMCPRKFVREHPYHADHVGMVQSDIGTYILTDFLGVFSFKCVPDSDSASILVLPRTFDLDDLAFSPGDSGLETISRATEDVSNPTDIRSYQPGDPLKKIHWKLSLRKHELMVRRFEEPVMQEAVVLLDCSEIASAGNAEKDLAMRDTMLETAASVMNQQSRTDHTVRMPLRGSNRIELDKSMGMPVILDNIARCGFTEEEPFHRVLLLETRRMRKIGAAVVISSRINGSMVDMMTRMRRMGPTLRFYYVSFDPDSKEILPMIGKLQLAGVEVCYVLPSIAQEVEK